MAKELEGMIRDARPPNHLHIVVEGFAGAFDWTCEPSEYDAFVEAAAEDRIVIVTYADDSAKRVVGVRVGRKL